MSRKQKYLSACAMQPASWLRACAASPSETMTPIHVALIKIALRRGWHI